MKSRAVNFSASVTLTSSDLFAPWLPASCIGRDRQDESCPESIHPTANGSHHTLVSLGRPLTSDLTHFSKSDHHYCTTITIITIILSSLPQPIGPDTLQSEPRLIKAFIHDQRQRPFHRHRHRQQIDARPDHANEGGGAFMRNRSLQ